jgi:hypothetical protein
MIKQKKKPLLMPLVTADSAWSRAPKDGGYRIGDFTHAEAMVYLKKHKIDGGKAVNVLQFCGSRVLLPKAVFGDIKRGTDLDRRSTVLASCCSMLSTDLP